MPFASTMPRAITKGPHPSVKAMNKSTGLYEWIPFSKETHKKFSHVGAPHKIPIPHYPRPHTKPLTLLQRMKISRKQAKHYAKLRLLSELTLQRNSLIHRIAHPPTLEQRISSPPPLSTYSYTPPPPLPKDLHFLTDKAIKWIKDVDEVLLATKICLEPNFKELKKEDEREHYGIAVRVSLEDRDSLWKWYSRLEDLYESDSLARNLTNKEWRDLCGACKRIGKVSFHKLAHRFPIICKNLVDLQITLP